MADLQLDDLGEARIVTELIEPRFPRATSGLKSLDDCAMESIANGQVVHTADPCPMPVVFSLFDPDPYHYGWMVVLINASDIAAMGATPLHVLLLIEAPGSMRVTSFVRILEGVRDASSEMSLPVSGGNIRDAEKLGVHGVALGLLDNTTAIQRAKVEDNQSIWVAGNTGHFWASVVLADKIGYRNAIEDETVSRALTRPLPQTKFAQELSRRGLSNAGMDASDGVMAALYSLASASNVEVCVDLDRVELNAWCLEVSARVGLDPLSASLAWGDWQLVFTIDPRNESQVLELGREFGVSLQRWGVAKKRGNTSVSFKRNKTSIEIPDLMPNKFDRARQGWSYADWLNYIRKAKI